MIIGLVLLIDYRIDYGTIIFTAGCIVETLATKIKYYGDEYVRRSRAIKHCLDEDLDISIIERGNVVSPRDVSI